MNIKLTDRDCLILKSLWKWKLLGTSSLTRKYFPERSPITAYKRLWMLKEAGYIQIERDEDRTLYAWGLTTKGFGVIRESLEVELEEEGFGSESINHDFLVSAIHIGDWLHGAPDGCGLFSEQQLRRYRPEHYPAWIPRSFLHRPDGYWLVPIDGMQVTIALEVELSRKKDPKYEILAEQYEAQPGIFRVVWLVPNAAFARYVQERLRKAVKDKSGIHDFIPLDAYRKYGWQTQFISGYETERTLAFLLNHRTETAPKPVSALFLLDGRLCPHKTKGSTFSEKTEKCYRLALTASPSITPDLSPYRTSPISHPQFSSVVPYEKEQPLTEINEELLSTSYKPFLNPKLNKEVNSYEK
jgi:hypothetical protein